MHALDRPVTVCGGIGALLRDERPEAVLSVLTRSNIVDVLRLAMRCGKMGIPLFLWVGDIERAGGPDAVPRAVAAPISWMFRKAMRSAAGFVSYSSATDDWLLGQGFGNKPRVTGTQVLDAPELEPRLGIKGRPSRVRVLFVGKHEARKGLPELISACQALPNSVLSVMEIVTVGTGPLSAELKARLAEIMPVTVKGTLSTDAVLAECRDADMLILPSIHDPWGFVTNEAMSMGTPVLASRYAGSRELAAKAGWVVDVRDRDDLVAGLGRAIAECRSEKRRALAVAAESEYRPAAAAQKILDLTRTLC